MSQWRGRFPLGRGTVAEVVLDCAPADVERTIRRLGRVIELLADFEHEARVFDKGREVEEPSK